MAASAILARFLLGAILWWEIFAANLLASAGMLAYFFLGHRALGGTLLRTSAAALAR